MKKKFILPMVAAAFSMSLFAACADDSSNPAEPALGPNGFATQVPTDPSVPENPSIQEPTDPSVQVPADPSVPGDSSVQVPTDPSVQVPADSAVPSEPVTGNLEDRVHPVDGMGNLMSWIRSDEGLPTFPNNESVVVDDFDAYTYYGAELSGVEQFKYGRFEARMKMVSIPGSVSSMFLYYDDSYLKGDIPWNEIDIEVLGKNQGQWQSNLITRIPDSETGRTNKNITSESKHQFGFNATEDFHLYAMIWTPEYISWEIDSVEVRRDIIGQKKGQVEFMTETQTLRFNLWASKSTTWVGKFTGAELANGPQTQYIDYVRVYSYDPATKTFTKSWQDDFDGTELSDRWSTGNWQMEHVMLSSDNVVVKDGFCQLMMTREQ